MEDRRAHSSAHAQTSSLRKPFPVQLILFAGLIFFVAYLVWIWLDRENNWLASLSGEDATVTQEFATSSTINGTSEDLGLPQAQSAEFERRTSSVEAKIAALQVSLQALAARLTGLEEEHSVRENAELSADPTLWTEDLAAIEDRLDGLEARFQDMDMSSASNSAAIDPINQETVVAGDLVDTRVNAIEQRLAVLEARNQSNFSRETRYAVSVAELYRAVLSGNRFDGELLETEALLLEAAPIIRVRTQPAVETPRPYALEGVPAFFELKSEFTAMIPVLLVTDRSQEAEGFWAEAWASIKELVILRRTGEVDGTDLEAVLAQAELDLAGGDLSAALDLLENRETNPEDLNQWIQKGRSRTEALAALTTLADSALEETGIGEVG